MFDLSKASDAADKAAEHSAARSEPGFSAVILNAGLRIFISSGRPQYS